MTIIRNISAYIEYEHLAIDARTLLMFQSAALTLKPYLATRARRCIRILEGYLQITNQELKYPKISTNLITKISREFIGALYSPHFMKATNISRYDYAYAFMQLGNAALSTLDKHTSPIEIALTYKAQTPEVADLVFAFSQKSLNEEKIELWKAWPTTNRNSLTYWLPLYKVHKRLGADFTRCLHSICDSYFSSRKCQRVPCIKPLADFIGDYNKPLTPSDFSSSSFTTIFLEDFYIFYLRNSTKRHKTSTINFICEQWRKEFHLFLNEHLVARKLFAKPYSVPTPRHRGVPDSRTNIKNGPSGFEIKTKLLTPVPLEAPNSVAMELLMANIKGDYGAVLTWAQSEASELWKRHQRRINQSQIGTVRTIQERSISTGGGWLTDLRNPDWLSNAATTFSYHGYQTFKDTTLRLLYPQPLSLAAYCLGMPTRLALLPYATLLIASHPCLTEAMLVDHELYDKNEKMAGFVPTDGGWLYVAYKDRRGAENAQTVINLTDETAELIKQIIEITEPLRKYLKSHNDDNWRLLFLCSGKSFGYPKKCRLAPPSQKETIYNDLIESISEESEISTQYARKLLNNFSLTAFRATAGVITYLNTRSLEKMAKTLGHKTYSHKLLSRYLPEPILAYFQERSIRIYQIGIIAESLKDSDHLLEASGFKSTEQLNTFLSNHVLKNIPVHLESPGLPVATNFEPQENEKLEVLFSIDIQTLQILVSLMLAVKNADKNISSTAKYWNEIAEGLVLYIERHSNYRPDLYKYLTLARQNANPDLVKGVVNE